MASITKILFRQGLNYLRRAQSIIFDLGEPAFSIDTKRLYIGDGITVGGVPAGVKNWGTITQLFSSASPLKYDATVNYIISAVESGDFIYSSSNLSLYYSTTGNPQPANWNQYTFAGLVISGVNGISVTTQNNVISAALGAGFTVNDPSQQITLNYNTVVANGKTLNVGGNISGSGNIISQGGSSTNWNSNYSTTVTNSATWGGSTSVVSINSASWNSNYSTSRSNSAIWNGPQFIPPILLAFGTTVSGWTNQSINPYVSATATGNVHTAILQVRIGSNAANWSQGIGVVTRPLSSVSYNYEIANTKTAGGGDNIMSTNQGFIPVNSVNNTFQWAVSGLGTGSGNPTGGCWIWLIGYIS